MFLLFSSSIWQMDFKYFYFLQLIYNYFIINLNIYIFII
jgi:hypothetical protein